MEETFLSDIPEWIIRRILLSLDFPALLNARLACPRWNDLIKPRLADQSILNIRMDKSPASKKFRRGKWNPSLIPAYREIRLIPKPENAYIYGKAKTWHNSSIKHFSHVQRFTLFENGSFLHFIHRYMALLPNLKYVQIRELRYNEENAADDRYYYFGQAFSQAIIYTKTWLQALENLSKVETLRIRLYNRLATIVYMQLFAFRPSNLGSMELDFSKLYGLPFPRHQLNELFNCVSDILENCYMTLKQFRMKWAIRVDTDLDYARSDEDVEPFFEFLLALRNPVWSKLRLSQLALTFPSVNFGMTLCETTLFPFFRSQEPTLKRLSISRVLPNVGVELFRNRFSASMVNRFEFGFYFMDVELIAQPVSYIRGLEVLLTEQGLMNFDSLLSLTRSRNEHALRRVLHFKLITGHDNENPIKPDIVRITEHFYNVRTLELLNGSPAGRATVQFTSADFNTILRRLGRLVSLKISNASLLTDGGITRIPDDTVRRMQQKGVYYHKDYRLIDPPAARAKELRYLDLRDLSASVSDISVYFAFQHIKKLEKISFHGSHSITAWGQQVLQAKKGKNPFFEAIFRSSDDNHVLFGNYSLPCVDFP